LVVGRDGSDWNIEFDAFFWREERWNIKFDALFWREARWNIDAIFVLAGTEVEHTLTVGCSSHHEEQY
jgi:hypothetical protein